MHRHQNVAQLLARQAVEVILSARLRRRAGVPLDLVFELSRMRHQAVKFSQLQRVLRRHVFFEPLFGASVELELAIHPARVVRTFRRISLSAVEK